MSTNESLKPVQVEDVEVHDLMVRNINGEGVLFTRDGKLVGHQIARMGHYYYVGQGEDRVKMFRASFLVDDMRSDTP